MSTFQEFHPRLNDSSPGSIVMYHRKFQRHDIGLAETLAKTMGLRDPFLLTHSLNVAVFAVKVARRLGICEEQVDIVRRSSMLHDIGKLGVSQDLLSKPAGLTEPEYEILKTHPARGAALLQECPEYQALIPIVRHHHEFFNGRGYPDGLAGEQIEIEARIVALAEVVAALSIDSPYRKACSMKKIINELNRCAGTQFDPLIVKVAIEILRDTQPKKHYSCKPRSNS